MAWQKMKPAQPVRKTEHELIEMAQYTGATLEQVRRATEEIMALDYFLNDRYQCTVRRDPSGDGFNFICLSIKRIDKEPIHDWRDLQRIKNDIVGPECEFVELYPAESRLVDTANQYWLWGSDNPAFRFPMGFEHGRVTANTSGGGAKQRPAGE